MKSVHQLMPLRVYKTPTEVGVFAFFPIYLYAFTFQSIDFFDYSSGTRLDVAAR